MTEMFFSEPLHSVPPLGLAPAGGDIVAVPQARGTTAAVETVFMPTADGNAPSFAIASTASSTDRGGSQSAAVNAAGANGAHRDCERITKSPSPSSSSAKEEKRLLSSSSFSSKFSSTKSLRTYSPSEEGLPLPKKDD